MLKKFLYISLTLIYLLVNCSAAIVYFIAKKELRSEFIRKLETDDVKNLTVRINSDDNIEILDKDELKKDGEWFDIYSKVSDGNKTIYCCIPDIKEKSLDKMLSEYVSDILSGNSKSAKSNFKIPDIKGISYLDNLNHILTGREIYLISNVRNLSSADLPISAPPPKI